MSTKGPETPILDNTVETSGDIVKTSGDIVKTSGDIVKTSEDIVRTSEDIVKFQQGKEVTELTGGKIHETMFQSELYENTIKDLNEKLEDNLNNYIGITPECLRIIVENAPYRDNNILRRNYSSDFYSSEFYINEETGDAILNVNGEEYTGITRKHAAAAYYQKHFKSDVFESAKSVLSYLNNYSKKNGLTPEYMIRKVGSEFEVVYNLHCRSERVRRDSIYDAVCSAIQEMKHEVDDSEKSEK